MPRAPAKTHEGPGFVMRGTKLAPAYEAIRKKVGPDLERLNELAVKKRLSAEEHEEVSRLLGQVGKQTFAEASKAMEKFNQNTGTSVKTFKDRGWAFWEDFGHVPPHVDHEDGRFEMECAGNAMAQCLILSEIAGDVGVLKRSGHITPTVKIGGRRYVLERDDLKEGRYPELMDYKFWERLRYHGGREAAYSKVYMNWGNTLLDGGDFKGAYRAYQRGLELDPMSAAAHNNIGAVAENLGRHEDAKGWYSKALKLDPKSAAAHTNLARIHIKERDLHTAESHLRALSKIEPKNPRNYESLGAIYEGKGDLGGALAAYREGFDKSPDNQELWGRICELEKKVGAGHPAPIN